jgi:2'-5' RNA ligase
MPDLRLFIAVLAPASVREHLLDVVQRLDTAGADVRWEAGGKFHCTLAFLGNTPSERIGDVAAAVQRAVDDIPPFAIGYRGIGFFPGQDRPRIVWGGIEDGGGVLVRAHEAIARELAAAGLPVDDKPFHAHVTLGRVRGLRHLRRLTTTAETCTLEHPPVTVREIVIVRSDLKPGGSAYTVLQSVPLTA